MNYSVFTKPEANQDIYQASLWYENQLKGLGYDFIDEVENLFVFLETTPLIFQKKHNEIREAPLKKFPFVVLYEIEKENIVIVFAVFHTSQNPKKKIKRISGKR